MEDREIAFKFNKNASYGFPNKWDTKYDGDLTKLKIYVNEINFFQANNFNIFSNYVLTFHNENDIQKWRSSCDMAYYQHQLNFAAWCASSGCGVSINDHLNSKSNLISSVYRFHIYYQTRKILEEMSSPYPGQTIFNATINRIDKLKFQKLCTEFNISTNSDFRFKGGRNGGLGTMYNYYPPPGGYRPVIDEGEYNPICGFNKKCQGFDWKAVNRLHIDYITQDQALEGWKQFLLEKANGFTKAGIVRIDDSVRAYVYCILGSQARTRSSILSSLESHQYFVDLLEQNIKGMFSIPESINQYQNSITQTHSRINFAVGEGLYMIPTDMVLKVGIIQNYNNNIVIANENVKLGLNENINFVSRNVEYTNEPIIRGPPGIESIVDKPPLSINNLYVSIGVSVLVLAFSYLYMKKWILKSLP